MGSNQSQARHRRPVKDPPYVDDLVDASENHIKISNKMVERLVEDAAIMNPSYKQNQASKLEDPLDWKENYYIENIEKMDEQHTEKYGLKVGDVRALARRVEARLGRMDNPDDVCNECAEQYQQLMECYKGVNKLDAFKCSETVDAFSRCIREASIARLQSPAEDHSVKLGDVTFVGVPKPPRVSAM